ncbi:hypothetical protein [Devosia riboflavina]|uniref:hypothetical protein n=1 Tax=Devosia riboflavina TaxID=46914 RepID=UPI001362DBDC|nr:hypothetical protein [Devosia riboflavina]
MLAIAPLAEAHPGSAAQLEAVDVADMPVVREEIGDGPRFYLLAQQLDGPDTARSYPRPPQS